MLLLVGALPLLFWAGVGGPTLAGVVGVGLFLIGWYLSTQWMMAGGMPPRF